MKSSKQSSKKSIISNKKSQISKNNENEEDDEKIPEDTVVNRKFNSENNTNSQIGKQNNLSQTGVNHLVLNPQIQQYISYNNGSNMIQNQNLTNTNYDISMPNNNNIGYIFQNSQPNPYIMMGNNSQIFGNNNYELYNNTFGYV